MATFSAVVVLGSLFIALVWGAVDYVKSYSEVI